MLYGRLDDLRDRASTRLAQVLRQSGGTLGPDGAGSAQRHVRQQLAQLDAAENGLCFGRLEFHDGERRYIGRIGMHADNDDYEQLLMDWRAAAARPFYLATAASPGDVRGARHIKTRGRTVVGLDDEVLDLAAGRPGQARGPDRRVGAAGRAEREPDRPDARHRRDDPGRAGLDHPVRTARRACGAGRTRHRQDRRGAAPGRVPAVHLPRQLQKRGVLVVGPNATFLRYIGQVLPSLGETSVLLVHGRLT